MGIDVAWWRAILPKALLRRFPFSAGLRIVVFELCRGLNLTINIRLSAQFPPVPLGGNAVLVLGACAEVGWR